MLRLDFTDLDFERGFAELVDARREADADVARDVRAILAAVRDEGDAALAAFTRRFDRHDPEETGWRIEQADCIAALEGLAPIYAPPSNSPTTASSPTTPSSVPRTATVWTTRASAWARVGARSRLPASMCRAAAPPIRPRF